MQNLPKLPNQKATEQENWQTRTYVTGITIGAIMGFLSAYMFNRAAEESEDGQPPTISTATLMGLALSIISLLRQISESGKPRKK